MMPRPPLIVLALLDWMESSRRQLPWRQRRDPYSIWVSEIMLQQTRVETVVPYYQGWMRRFPDIQSLASASLEEVLKAWEGLGYYTRARNLHRAAQQVVACWGGHLPAERLHLLTLPGIGQYTAGAILSLAWNLPEPALDGNARRVLCRLYDIAGDVDHAGNRDLLWRMASDLLTETPPGYAGDLTEALMELGALVCRPGAPDCRSCPIAEMCLANHRGVQRERPVRSKRRALQHFDAAAGVVYDGEHRYLIVQRNVDGLLGGLWGFPGCVVRDGRPLTSSLEEAIANMVGVNVEVRGPLTTFRHAYTHFAITLHAYRCWLLAGTPRALNCLEVQWASPEEIARLPLPVTDRRILRCL
jgi:A/G-specific adenine glycosylase